MSNSIPHARTVWTESFGDIQIYTGNTLKVVFVLLCKVPEKILSESRRVSVGMPQLVGTFGATQS